MTGLLAGFAGGMGLGAAYFGALWLTVRRLHIARRPGGLALASYFGRLAIAGLGFYGVLQMGGTAALLSALVGFLVVRHTTARWVARDTSPTRGAWS